MNVQSTPGNSNKANFITPIRWWWDLRIGNQDKKWSTHHYRLTLLACMQACMVNKSKATIYNTLSTKS